MCRPLAWSPFQEKAIRLPSGEKVGPDSRPGTVVNGTTRSGGDGGSGAGVPEAAGDRSVGRSEYSQMPPPSTSARAALAAGQTQPVHGREGRGVDAVVAVVLAAPTRPESRSRFSRFRSVRSSAAVWQRTSRSFSSAL